jgi:hypothetical protein
MVLGVLVGSEEQLVLQKSLVTQMVRGLVVIIQIILRAVTAQRLQAIMVGLEPWLYMQM